MKKTIRKFVTIPGCGKKYVVVKYDQYGSHEVQTKRIDGRNQVRQGSNDA